LVSLQRVGSQRLVVVLQRSGNTQPFTVQPVNAYTPAATPVTTPAAAGELVADRHWDNPVAGSCGHMVLLDPAQPQINTRNTPHCFQPRVMQTPDNGDV
jgi:hypothetical protein